MHINLEENNYQRGTYVSHYSAYEERPLPMKICAPAQFMDMRSIKVSNNYKLESSTPVYYTDPVVIQPVHDGYLIVSAWGNEASDPIVVNPLMN